MKKVIVFLMCVFSVTAAMSAEPTCNGGILITAHKATDEGCSATTCNGHEFCKSDKLMNWWSAFTWCESQNRKLADFSKMCPNTLQSPTGTAGNCPNLQGKESGWGWSSLVYDSERAFVVEFSSGAVYFGARTNVTNYALCE